MAVVPYVPAGAGLVVRGGKVTVEAATHTDEVADVLRWLENASQHAYEDVRPASRYLQNRGVP